MAMEWFGAIALHFSLCNATHEFNGQMVCGWQTKKTRLIQFSILRAFYVSHYNANLREFQ